MGGDVALAKAAHLRRQTLQDWYSERDVPGLPGLQQLADALDVRRVDLIAAYDGVTAPETKEAPAPKWAQGLDRKLDEVIQALPTPERLDSVAILIARLEALVPPPAAASDDPEEGQDQDELATPQREGE